MVAGDVITNFSVVNTQIIFVPAVGVECLITSCFRSASATSFGLHDGVNNSYISPAGTETGSLNMKVFINNSIGFRLGNTGAATYGSFSGVQIK